MLYHEYPPSSHLSQHVECFWELTAQVNELNNQAEMLPPDCTFEFTFSNQAYELEFLNGRKVTNPVHPASFLGQRTGSLRFHTSRAINIFGIRFKPFAFANLVKTPLHLVNDQVIPLSSVFKLNECIINYINDIHLGNEPHSKIEIAENLISELFKGSLDIDQKLRAQTNYILDRKGLIKVKDILTGFGTNKATLRNNFIKKLGLGPKQVARIWRINYFLELQKREASSNLTKLCLEAGYYDQAHFIKEFKYFFNHSPRQLLHTESQLLRISQDIITRRFSNQYDPR